MKIKSHLPAPSSGRYIRLAILVSVLLAGCVVSLDAASHKIVAVNTAGFTLRNHAISLEINRLPEEFQTGTLNVLTAKGEPLPSQTDDLNGDAQPDELVFEADVPAGQRRTFRITTGAGGGREETESQLRVDENFTLQNRFYRWKWEGPVHDKNAGVVAVSSLKHHMDNSSNLQPAGKPVIVASGPVRAVVQQTYEKRKSGLLFRKRYYLYENDPAIHWEVEITNTSEKPRALPSFEAKALAGQCENCLIPEGVTKRGITTPYRAAHTDRDAGAQEHNYKHKLFVNEENGYALSVVHPSINGFQRIRQSPGAKPHQIRFRHLSAMGQEKNFGRDARYSELKVGPGATRTLHLALAFHSGQSTGEFVEKHRKNLRRQLGTLNVHEPDGRVLKTARAHGYVNDEFRSGTRWFASEGVRMNVNGDKMKIRTDRQEGYIFTALRRDFRDPTVLEGEIDALTAGTGLTVELLDTRSGKRYALGPVKGNEFSWNLSDRLPFEDERRLFLRLRLQRSGEGGNAMRASIERIRLSWPSPSVPRAVAPKDGIQLSDIAVTFTVIPRTPMKTDGAVEVQVAREPGFREPLYTYRETVARTVKLNSENITPDEVYEPGTYYWRARAIGLDGSHSAWTETRRFKVKGERADNLSRVRPVSTEHPLIIVPSAKNNRAVKGVWRNLPDHLRKYFAFEWKLRLLRDVDLMKWIGEQPDYPMILQFHQQADLAMLEGIFREYPRVVGVEFGEKGADITSFRRTLGLAARYGRYGIELGNSDWLWMGCRDTPELIRRYRDYFLTIPKSNNEACPLARYLVQFGMYLSGRSSYCGAETEWWNARRTREAGVQTKTTRPVDWMPPLLMGLVTGSKVWRIEGFISTKKTHAWRKKSDEEQKLDGPLWRRALRPFFTDVITRRMIPSRQALRKKVRVGFQATPRFCEASLRSPQSRFPHRKLAAAHGVHEQYAGKTIFGWRWVPDSSRNFLVPVLPLDRNENERGHPEHVVRFNRFDTPEAAGKYVRQFYPDRKGKAFSVLVGDTGVITNSNDLRVHSRPQDFALGLTRGPVRRVSGTVTFHQYYLLKQGEDDLFVHANNYRERKSTLTIHGRSPLDVSVKPAEALVRKSTGNTGQDVKLTLSHEHSGGVARVIAGPR